VSTARGRHTGILKTVPRVVPGGPFCLQ